MIPMTKEAFLEDTLRWLAAQIQRYPEIQPQDVVKFAFQATLGVGHLLSDRESVTRRISDEINGLKADCNEPLFEQLSPVWCRLNLRRAVAEGFGAETVAGLMLSSTSDIRFTRQDVLDLSRIACASAGLPLPDEEELNKILRDDWMPSHSAIYKKLFQPAYRVVSAEWACCENAIGEIIRKQTERERLLVTLDGPCASGKTTLAKKLASAFHAAVAHTDDYVVPHSQKTKERLAIPGGNCDADRLMREIVLPWKKGETAFCQKYDCATDRLLPAEALPMEDMLILEGCYCNLPDIRKHADVRLFLDAPWHTREERLLQRESETSMRQFYTRWIPLENAYFEAYHLPDEGCTRILPQE